MKKSDISGGVVHEMPDDLREVLIARPELLVVWNSLTPLARNERICRVTIVKKEETRAEHLVRLGEDLLE